MVTDSGLAQRPRPRGWLRRLWGHVCWIMRWLRRLLTCAAVAVLALELLTPSLDFSKSAGDFAFNPDYEQTHQAGSPETDLPPGVVRRARLMTTDSRFLTVDVQAPPGILESGPIPLTIIVPGLMTPDWALGPLEVSGHNAVIVYHSPREARVLGPNWPALTMLDQQDGGLWTFLTTNPLTKGYALHQALHEAPLDVAEIARWATTAFQAESGRINLIGIGSGALVAAAAADRMRAMGIPARTLTLVYPPADLDLAIRDLFFGLPEPVSSVLGSGLALLYRRLELARHLPAITHASKQLIIPLEAMELASYSALPAVDMAGRNSRVVEQKFGYSSLTLTQNVVAVRDIIWRWLRDQGAIN